MTSHLKGRLLVAAPSIKPSERQHVHGSGTGINSNAAKICYILGAGHCGSTLLGLLLGTHPDVVYVGELWRLGRHPESTPPQGPEVAIAFWRAVGTRYEELTGRQWCDVTVSAPQWRLSGAALDARAVDEIAILDAIAAEAGVSVVVDASKRHGRAELLMRLVPDRVRIIHLERDGRAVYGSYRRKGWRRLGALRRWAAPTLAASLLRQEISKTRWLRLRYEDLARQPEATVRDVWSFLGLCAGPVVVDLATAPDVSLGGNRMRRSREAGVLPPQDGWSEHLNTGDRLVFQLAGGGVLNRLRGYPAC
jgi:Sulfotransferase family